MQMAATGARQLPFFFDHPDRRIVWLKSRRAVPAQAARQPHRRILPAESGHSTLRIDGSASATGIAIGSGAYPFESLFIVMPYRDYKPCHYFARVT
jgi:hypothetical protein